MLGQGHRVTSHSTSLPPRRVARWPPHDQGLREDRCYATRRDTIHARYWARHQTITDPDHAAARTQTAKGPVPADEVEVEQRSLETYDRIFGVIYGGLSEEGVA
ncbi:hypothetical protein ACIHFC_37255 [Streptomyces sp. NPDC052013]|uniref:hypothetical protein n=1 Tax=Streptomyces sp. NPDC052013 TaxID=3365679 RepID=UPI0037D6A06B